jgi:hypothetical protein
MSNSIRKLGLVTNVTDGTEVALHLRRLHACVVKFLDVLFCLFKVILQISEGENHNLHQPEVKSMCRKLLIINIIKY